MNGNPYGMPDSFFRTGPRCVIFGAGEHGRSGVFPGPGTVLRTGDCVIAADGGYTYLRENGLPCSLLMGDLDSLPQDTELPDEILRFPPEKDDTDTMLAVRTGFGAGYRDFLLYGVFGGRFDHTAASLQTVEYLCASGAGVFAFEADERTGRWKSYVTAVRNGTLFFPAGAAGYLSLFAAGGIARGVTLTGLKYPLYGATLRPDRPLGVSNEFLPDTAASVTVRNGMLLVIRPFPETDA